MSHGDSRPKNLIFGPVVLFSLSLFCSCGPAPSPVESPKAVPASSASPRSVQVETDESVAPPSSPSTEVAPPRELSLMPGARRTIQGAKMIVPPIADQLLESSLATRLYRMSCPKGRKCSKESKYFQLDDHSPRSDSGGRTLSSLLVEDQEIAPGGHSLAAFALFPEALFVETARFKSVVSSANKSGSSQAVNAAHEGCRLLLPLPTQNGSSAQALRILAVFDPLLLPHEPAAEVSISYRLESQAQSAPFASIVATGVFPQGTEAVLKEAPPGDFVVEATCLVDGQIFAKAQRRVTLNPELGVQAR